MDDLVEHDWKLGRSRRREVKLAVADHGSAEASRIKRSINFNVPARPLRTPGVFHAALDPIDRAVSSAELSAPRPKRD